MKWLVLLGACHVINAAQQGSSIDREVLGRRDCILGQDKLEHLNLRLDNSGPFTIDNGLNQKSGKRRLSTRDSTRVR